MSESKKGVIYIMTTIVPGIIKIGKTKTDNYEKRMYYLEHNGYCNVVGLKRKLAIEVDDFDDKEAMMHTVFAQRQIANTELFAIDVNVAMQLFSALDGKVIYPKDETKGDIFTGAAGATQAQEIYDGEYFLERNIKSDNKIIKATVMIKAGTWTLLKDSVLSMNEGYGVPKNVKIERSKMCIDANGVLQEDYYLGACSPSFAGALVINQSCNGWVNWKDSKQECIDKFRKKVVKDSEE